MTATIPVSASESAAVNLNGCVLIGLIIPASFEGNQIAFKAGMASDALVSVEKMDGNQLTVTAESSKYIAFDHTTYRFRNWLQLVSQTTGVAEVQTGADCVITLVVDVKA